MKFFLRVSPLPHYLDEAAENLRAGTHRHDVLDAGIRAVEEITDIGYIGRGGIPDILGRLRHDGAFMNGNTREFGGIASVEFLPVRFARRLMERSLHTLLVGPEADIFARDAGLADHDLTPTSERQLAIWREKIEPLLLKHHINPQTKASGDIPLIDVVESLTKPEKEFDTVIMIASDGNGLSGAASTTGWGYKHPGRVGDTPICGAGMYVDSRFGGACCTHTGEMSMRGGTSRYVVSKLETGCSVEEAVKAGIDDLATLRGGVWGSLVIYAVDAKGEPCVKAINVGDEPIYYWYWNETMAKPERRELPSSAKVELPKLVG